MTKTMLKNEDSSHYAPTLEETKGPMSEERRAAALKRIKMLSEGERQSLVLSPYMGWEDERILLADEASYSLRILAEVGATSRAQEIARIRAGLIKMQEALRLSDQSKHHLQHNHLGTVAGAVDEIPAAIDGFLKAIQKTLGRVTVTELAREFGCTTRNITYHLEKFDRIKGTSRGNEYEISLEDAQEFRAYMLTKRRKTRGKSRPKK
jgi:hypothetical protein